MEFFIFAFLYVYFYFIFKILTRGGGRRLDILDQFLKLNETNCKIVSFFERLRKKKRKSAIFLQTREWLLILPGRLYRNRLDGALLVASPLGRLRKKVLINFESSESRSLTMRS
jgi:hypothetical protein